MGFKLFVNVKEHYAMSSPGRDPQNEINDITTCTYEMFESTNDTGN